jgi:hypothetical protein
MQNKKNEKEKIMLNPVQMICRYRIQSLDCITFEAQFNIMSPSWWMSLVFWYFDILVAHILLK